MSNRGAPWEEVVVAERMAADGEFQDRVQASSFTNQSWGLVMMATEFEVTNSDDPEQAHMVANVDQLDSVLPAMKEVDDQMGVGAEQSTTGVMDSLRNLLGSGSNDDERRREAEELTTEYARVLQRHIVEAGKWEQVCEIASEQP